MDTCELCKMFFENSLKHCAEMRKSYRQYIAFYGINLGMAASIPFIYSIKFIERSNNIGFLYNIGGIVIGYASSALIILSLRAFCKETKINICHMRQEQIIREDLLGCSNDYFQSLPMIGLKPLIKQNKNSKKWYYISPEPSKGYFDLTYIISFASFFMLFTTWVHIEKIQSFLFVFFTGLRVSLLDKLQSYLLHDTRYNVLNEMLSSFFINTNNYSVDLLIFFSSAFAILSMIKIWGLTLINHLGKAHAHLSSAKGITRCNPSPDYPHSQDQINKFSLKNKFYVALIISIFIEFIFTVCGFCFLLNIPPILISCFLIADLFICLYMFYFLYDTARLYHSLSGRFLVAKANIEQFNFYNMILEIKDVKKQTIIKFNEKKIILNGFRERHKPKNISLHRKIKNFWYRYGIGINNIEIIVNIIDEYIKELESIELTKAHVFACQHKKSREIAGVEIGNFGDVHGKYVYSEDFGDNFGDVHGKYVYGE